MARTRKTTKKVTEKKISWAADLSEYTNLPTDEEFPLRRFKNGEKGPISIFRQIPLTPEQIAEIEARTGRKRVCRYDRDFIGYIVGTRYYSSEEYFRLFKRKAVPRVSPRPAPEPQAESLPSAPAEEKAVPAQETPAAPVQAEKKSPDLPEGKVSAPASVPRAASPRQDMLYVGPGPLIWEMAREMGLLEDLQKAFGHQNALSLMSAVIYAMSTNELVIKRMEPWSQEHFLPYNEKFSNGEFGEFLRQIGLNQDGFQKFFSLRKARESPSAEIYFDATNMGYESRLCPLSCKGKGKEGGYREQISLSLLVGSPQTGALHLDLYEGSLHDIKNLKDLLGEIAAQSKDADKGFTLVVDRGYFAEDLLNMACALALRLVVAGKQQANWVNKLVDKALPELDQSRTSLPNNRGIHGVRMEWDPECDENKGVSGPERVWLYVYRDKKQHQREKQRLMERLDVIKAAIDNDEPLDKEQSELANLLVRNESGELELDYDLVDLKSAKFGLFVNIATWEASPAEIYEIYSGRNDIEQHFKIGKSCLDLGSVRAHSTGNAWGRALVGAIGMSIWRYLEWKMSMKHSIAEHEAYLKNRTGRGRPKERIKSLEELGISVKDALEEFSSLRVVMKDKAGVAMRRMTGKMELIARSFGVLEILKAPPEYCEAGYAEKQIALDLDEAKSAS